MNFDLIRALALLCGKNCNRKQRKLGFLVIKKTSKSCRWGMDHSYCSNNQSTSASKMPSLDDKNIQTTGEFLLKDNETMDDKKLDKNEVEDEEISKKNFQNRSIEETNETMENTSLDKNELEDEEIAKKNIQNRSFQETSETMENSDRIKTCTNCFEIECFEVGNNFYIGVKSNGSEEIGNGVLDCTGIETAKREIRVNMENEINRKVEHTDRGNTSPIQETEFVPTRDGSSKGEEAGVFPILNRIEASTQTIVEHKVNKTHAELDGFIDGIDSFIKEVEKKSGLNLIQKTDILRLLGLGVILPSADVWTDLYLALKLHIAGHRR